MIQIAAPWRSRDAALGEQRTPPPADRHRGCPRPDFLRPARLRPPTRGASGRGGSGRVDARRATAEMDLLADRRPVLHRNLTTPVTVVKPAR